MTHPTPRSSLAFALGGLLVLLGVLQGVLSPDRAEALAGSGHGPGYLSDTGWWLGTYRLDDGAQGFCLDAGKESPTGHSYDYVDAATLGRFSAADAAKLAYISRTWAGTRDRTVAAAGQIATWMVAGLGGKTAESIAERAGADAAAVLAEARRMSSEADSMASTGARAAVVVELAETGPGRVRVELTADRLSGPELLPPRRHTAVLTVHGAAFADGSTTASVPTGTDIEITPTDEGPDVSVEAEAVLGELPYGSRLLVATPRDDAQAVLVAQSASTDARGTASASGPSPLPFRPTVETVTSDAHVTPGTAVTDHLTVGVEQGDGLLPTWGVRRSDDGFAPVEAIVESTLYGPFDGPLDRADEPPAGAPTVCTVETIVARTGDYVTPECIVPEPGTYVWAERIDPARTDADAGGERLRPWSSDFGIVSETTVAAAPPVATAPKAPRQAAPAADAQSGTTQLAATGSADGARTDLLALLGAGIVALGVSLRFAAYIRRRA